MAGGLIELARKKFGQLTLAEELFFSAIAEGRYPDYSSPIAAENDPAQAAGWPAERTLYADRIAWLATDPEAVQHVTHRGIGLKGAWIEGRLDLQAANITFALYFDHCAIPSGINLLAAEIHALNLSGSHTGRISADGLQVESNVVLRAGFTALGRVRMLGAIICGNLDCEAGRFISPSGEALAIDGSKIAGSVNFNGGFRAQGEVRLIGAQIGCNLSCDGGEFLNRGKAALLADRIKVEGNVFLTDGFRAQGAVALPSAMISAYLLWRNVAQPVEATLDLRSAKVGTLWISRESWPAPGELLVHGLVYDELDDHARIDAATRVEWLRLQPKTPFRPQPYEQLAAVLRKDGQEAEAKQVLYAKELDRAHRTKLTWAEMAWYRFFGPLIGYGYKPWRAFFISLAVIVFGALLFHLGDQHGLMVPSKAEGLIIEAGQPPRVSENFAALQPLVYSLDTFTPLIDLGQADNWQPNANRGREFSLGLCSVTSGGLLRGYMWLHIIAGWTLSTLLFIGLTGSVPGA